MKATVPYIILLCGLGTLGYFGADMYIPALPELESYFNSTKSAVGLTFSIYMFGITIGQLFYGTVSDRFGRKYTLIFGLSLFVLASIACMLSTHIVPFIIWRLLQALGACAAMVIWQAMVIDRFDNARSHQIFAIVFPMLALSPALAPTLGGFIMTFSSWQMIFAVLAVIALLFIGSVCCLTETTSKESQAASQMSFIEIKKKYKMLLGSSFYMGHICTLGLTSGAYFCYLTASPFILKQMGYSVLFIGLSYIPQTVAFMAGGFISKKVLDTVGVNAMWYCLCVFVFFSFILFCATIFFPLVNAMQIIIPFSIMALLNGVLYPRGMSLALNHFPKLAGSAAGLAGSMQALIAFVGTSLLSLVLFLGVISMSIMIVLLSVGGLLVFRKLVKSP